MKHKILFFGAVLVFLVYMCGYNAGKSDVSESSDTVDIFSSSGKTETVTKYVPGSCPQECEQCPYLSQCTKSQNRTKIVTQHIWNGYLEICEDIRCTRGNKELYQKRK